MKQYPFLNGKAGKCVFGLFLFAMLMLARDTLVTSSLLGFEKSQFLMLGLVCLLGLGFLIRNWRNLKQILLDGRMGLVLFTAVLILLPMLVKRDWQMMYFSILLCPVIAVFFSYFTTFRDVARSYVVILTFLSAYSVFASYVLKFMGVHGMISPPVFYNPSGWDFYNFGLCYAVTWYNWFRNFGIFREPGVYQFFIILAMYLNNYTVEWRKHWQTWLVNGILFVTMLTTLAIGGYIEMFLFIIFLYFDKKWHKNKLGKRIGLAAVVIGTAIVVHIAMKLQEPGVAGTYYVVFYDMVERLTTGSDSLVDRLDAIFTNMHFVFRNPILGNAIEEVLHGTNHNTSSTLILYAILGVAGGTWNVVSWFAMGWDRKRNIIGNLILMLIFFMSFNTQNLTADVFFWLLPFMALTEQVVPKMKFPGKKE